LEIQATHYEIHSKKWEIDECSYDNGSESWHTFGDISVVDSQIGNNGNDNDNKMQDSAEESGDNSNNEKSGNPMPKY